MAKNTGKPSERAFEEAVAATGKEGWCYRIKDAAAIHGIAGRTGHGVDATPADYILVLRGEMSFCEVKSTQHETLFEFSLLTKGQRGHYPQIAAAGGRFIIFLHRLTTGQWYMIPMKSVVEHTRTTGRKSITWKEMEEYRWPSTVASLKVSRPVLSCRAAPGCTSRLSCPSPAPQCSTICSISRPPG